MKLIDYDVRALRGYFLFEHYSAEILVYYSVILPMFDISTAKDLVSGGIWKVVEGDQ